MESSGNDHPALRMPDIESVHGATYVISLLHEAGLMSSTGMGPVPLSWAEIESWLTVTQRVLPLWERTMIKQLSEAYVNELLLGTDPLRESPFILALTDDEIDREKVEKKFLSFASRFRPQQAEATAEVIEE